MIRALTGIQIGPRQFELPPNMPRVRLGRQIGNAVFLAAGVNDIGMVGVVARQRADAVGAQELVLVEHLRQHAAELGFVQDRSQPAAGDAGLSRVVDRRAQFGPSVEEPLEPLREFRVLRQQASRRKTVAAHSGSRPTIDRTLSRWAWPSGNRSTS